MFFYSFFFLGGGGGFIVQNFKFFFNILEFKMSSTKLFYLTEYLSWSCKVHVFN